MAAAARSAVITGAGGGLGKAIATEFLKGGYKVGIVDINRGKVESTAKELSLIGEVLPLHADITKEESIKDVFKKSVSAFGQVDALVNCAGIRDNFEGAHDLNLDTYSRTIAVNLTAPVLMSKYAINEFLRSGRKEDKKGGSIVNIASVAAIRGSFSGVAYTTSKSGMIGLTRNTAALYAGNGINCNVILPGALKTAFMEGGDEKEYGMAWVKMRKAVGTNPAFIDINKLGRLARFLSSEDGSEANGAVITFDAGWTAH